MKKIIVEVGSTVTKINSYDGIKMQNIKNITIPFKKNYIENNNELLQSDIDKLVEIINLFPKDNILVYGTSIFRELNEYKRKEFLEKFKHDTGIDFNIISQIDENIYTVKGATKNVKEAVVLVGGGGSIEISYYCNGKIVKMENNEFGAIDVMNKFLDLSNDKSTTSFEKVLKYIDERIIIPNELSDILILAGGGHEYFARNSGMRYSNNILFNDDYEPILMETNKRIEDTKKYYEFTSLDDIRKKVNDPDWWYATRAMCAIVLTVAKRIGAKYIVPTDISLANGIILEVENEEKKYI